MELSELSNWLISPEALAHNCGGGGEPFPEGWRCVGCGEYVPQEILDADLLAGYGQDIPLFFSKSWEQYIIESAAIKEDRAEPE